MDKLIGARMASPLTNSALMRFPEGFLWLCLLLFGGGFVSAQPQSANKPAANAPDKYGWLFAPAIQPAIQNEAMTTALREIWALPQPETEREINALTAARDKASEEGRRAADLLLAAAFERKGNLGTARDAYQAIAKQAPGTPYAVSADARARLLSDPPRPRQEQEQVYEKIAEEPAANGWFLVAGQWGWEDSRRAAQRSLIDLRGADLSFRLFSYLRSKSAAYGFPTPYAYLFVLIALSIGAKLLALPIYIKAARLQAQMKNLASEIEMINHVYAGDEMMRQHRLMKLYEQHRINFLPGCAVGLLDLIFVVWALVALSGFSPQMALDGAKFWWVPDVLQRDIGVLIALFCFIFIQGLVSAAKQSGVSKAFPGMLVFCGAIVAIAWYWHWPASVIIFWILLSVIGLIINFILVSALRMFK